ncbi:hypothetical protein DEU56DRAFT_399535 [Suillus clintonianus]|uniref:uncharacterized protein n=1 Tax=Suillus clintonianus TaxID=1904413 RepID=UPI001B869D72|nr:uncharacterized protein DEU56DRAFT_399535 [Suillus clintonianus]KAG2135128.1 hypothetical protein DEU56DRAFT_399535 [Suillus clintonianus]
MDHICSQSDSTEYQPSVADILKVKRYLQFKLPAELIDRIIDDACYWAHSTVYIGRPFTVPIYRNGKRSVDGVYIRSLPLGIRGTEGDIRLVEEDFEDGGVAWEKKLQLGGLDDASSSAPTLSSHPCRKIEFQLWCHDQSVRKKFPHAFSTSFVWADVSIESLQTPISEDDTIEWPAHLLFEECSAELSRSQQETGKPFNPPSLKLRKNIAMKTSGSTHPMFWHFRDSFHNCKDPDDDCVWHFIDKTFDRDAAKSAQVGRLVRSMEVGDCVTLWVQNRHPESEDNVQEARITVYWAV